MFLREALFADRSEAGAALAQRLLKFKDERPVVLALPRGVRATSKPTGTPPRSKRRSI